MTTTTVHTDRSRQKAQHTAAVDQLQAARAALAQAEAAGDRATRNRARVAVSRWEGEVRKLARGLSALGPPGR